MTQAIEILEKHRLFLIEVEREADVQEAIKAVVITVKQQAEEIERLRELVKRYEDALEWMFAQDDWFVSRKPLLSNKGTTLTGQETEFDTIGPLRKYSYSFHLEEVEFTADTPLAAIEAAMKEEK